MNKGFKSLPSWAKGTVAVLMLGTIIVGGYFAIRGVKKGIQRIKDSSESKAVKDDLKDLNSSQTTKQTMSDSQANGFASRLYVAMDGNGTDTNAIYDVLSNLKNDADVLALIKAFGTKKLHNSLLWEEVVYEGGLSGAMQDELSSSELRKANSILEGKSIKYRF